MIELINQYSSLITLIFSLVVALSTVIYSILTGSLVRETKIMRKSQTEPVIIAYIEPSLEWINIINIHIKNIGVGAAENITFKVLKDYTDTKGRKFSENQYIKNGIKFLPPQGDYCSLFDNVVGKDFSKSNEMSLSIIVYYQNRKIKYQRGFIIDLNQYTGLLRIGGSPIHEIERSLERIEKGIDKMTRVISSNRISVKVISEEQARKEEEQLMAEMEKENIKTE